MSKNHPEHFYSFNTFHLPQSSTRPVKPSQAFHSCLKVISIAIPHLTICTSSQISPWLQKRLKCPPGPLAFRRICVRHVQISFLWREWQREVIEDARQRCSVRAPVGWRRFEGLQGSFFHLRSHSLPPLNTSSLGAADKLQRCWWKFNRDLFLCVSSFKVPL